MNPLAYAAEAQRLAMRRFRDRLARRRHHLPAPDPDHALRPRPTEPVRDERGVSWPVRERGFYRPVADETESELGYGR